MYILDSYFLDQCSMLMACILLLFFRMNFLSNILREEGGFDYKKAIVDSIVILISDIPDAKEVGLLHLCEFIEDCEFTYLSTQVLLPSRASLFTVFPFLLSRILHFVVDHFASLAL